MLRPHHLVLLASLLMDGGTGVPQPTPPSADAGTSPSPPDAGAVVPPPQAADAIQWPKDLRPLATLDGPAVLAAHAALQRVLSQFPKNRAGACTSSAQSLEVVVGQEGGLYFVRVDRRPDKCGWAPGTALEFDWFEFYAVSPDGRVLARYPYMP
jgi:hypothetical protein